jgi:hypothetical protein
VAVGREISKGVRLSLEVSVPIIRDFPVYNFKTELRMVGGSDLSRWIAE